MKKKTLLLIFALIFHCQFAYAELWKITAYCACKKCTAPYSDGRFASNKPVYQGGIALNWLPFGTKVLIDGKLYTVEDRGAKSLFGSKTNHIKHIDVYMKSHEDALKFGVKYLEVEIL